MSTEEKLTAEETTLFIMKALPIKDQFRVTTYMKSVLRMMSPSPSTRWYDYCNLHWPDDIQSMRMDRNVTLDEVRRRLSVGEPLRKIISRDGRWIGLRWKSRIRSILQDMTYFTPSYREWLRNMEWP